VNRIFFLLAVFLLFSVSAFGQRDGGQRAALDSVIISSAQAGIPDSVQIDIFIATFDTISFFNIPLTWKTTCPAIYPVRCEYSDLVKDHDVTAEIVHKTNQIRLFGPGDRMALCTDGQRRLLASLRFTIDEGAVAESVLIDTCMDQTFGDAYFRRAGDRAKAIPVIVNGKIEIQQKIVQQDSSQYTGLRLVGQNYPNPFCGRTIISFYVGSSQLIKIQLMSITGQEVYSSESYFKAGEHSISPNLNNVPSGVYLYKVSSQDTTVTGRITLLK
jgi:hypothetical protein